MRIVITGGGTGGHILPGLALWRYIEKRHPGAKLLYLGSERGLEKGIVTRAGLPFATVEAAGLKRQLNPKALPETLRTFFITYRGYRQALRRLRTFDPDVVVGTGGYVTLPVVFAAHRLGIPSVIWEANARPGLTNLLCARKADAVAISFADSRKWFTKARKVVFTGNPRASEVVKVSSDDLRHARDKYGVDAKRKLIVVYAGSRGAETVNRVMVDWIPSFHARPDWQLFYVTGEAHYDSVMASIPNLPSNVRLFPFIDDMPSLLPQADVVVTRAGGATLAEICALGLASILIPSPYVTANHQEENAMRLVERGAAVMVRESELSAGRLGEEVAKILEQGAGLTLRENARRLATPRAVEDLYGLVMDVQGRGRLHQ
ncbi:undecaprenyldiphospho-muramoylpentapeptide beta-N-acetylglucosaminyltransferase [Alicyclobacillus herbarius]|uniref:undecaprenyldiphospho-muramoylpentapeptide beta-N-acetylglucosaminyltransferase n=1 Tax=Alicyclobacillus herbarius TaxID=122960 RepID=UPI00041A39CB|nr:undecaprenyldiphospho-muramoylpentapeptide beta-N-acetylglucosaminyltransferase [Alicyclobacillus herbarius]